MKSCFLLGLALLLLACSSPPALTPPTTKATALVRLTEELAILTPLVVADSASRPRRYYTFTPAPADSAFSPAVAAQLLREAPDALNQLAETPFISSLITSRAQKAALAARLQALLQRQPGLDLGWVWLAALQTDSTQAVAALSRAIALNGQVGAYYRQRASCYQLQGNYQAAAQDFRRALPRYANRWQVYQDLADTYILLHDDQQYSATWNLRQAGMRQALRRLEQRTGPALMQDIMHQDSVRRLREEIAYGYLAKALYFIEQRHQPAMGCPDLARAAAAGVEEAPALQRQYCR